MKETKFAGLADAKVNVPSTKITSLALTTSLIGSFSLVLCFIRQLTNQHAPFNPIFCTVVWKQHFFSQSKRKQ